MLKINGKSIKAIKIYGINIVRAYCEGKLVFGNLAGDAEAVETAVPDRDAGDISDK